MKIPDGLVHACMQNVNKHAHINLHARKCQCGMECGMEYGMECGMECGMEYGMELLCGLVGCGKRIRS
jgi:hypothetical protein